MKQGASRDRLDPSSAARVSEIGVHRLTGGHRDGRFGWGQVASRPLGADDVASCLELHSEWRLVSNGDGRDEVPPGSAVNLDDAGNVLRSAACRRNAVATLDIADDCASSYREDWR